MEEKRYTLSETERAEVVERLERALAQYPEIVFAYLHGSFLLEFPFHDVDVALYVKDSLLQTVHPMDYIIDQSVRLSDAVGLPVDVHLLNGAPLGFQFHATAGQVLLSRDEEQRFQFVERVRREYWDFEPMLRQYFREVAQGSNENP
ncbi:MAG: nucleotidyltransferase domain-containing protein [Fimbriimonadales bacterium]